MVILVGDTTNRKTVTKITASIPDGIGATIQFVVSHLLKIFTVTYVFDLHDKVKLTDLSTKNKVG